jgi:hypothetical protein
MGVLTERDDLLCPAFFLFNMFRKETRFARFITQHIFTMEAKIELHKKLYSYDELADRSADFEELIDKLVELTDIPEGMRNISSVRARVNQLTAQIYEIVRYNRRVGQHNVVQQSLFKL